MIATTMTTWFTSDQHWNHSNIINLCDRPFDDVLQMNEVLIKNYQEVVKPKDSVFFLGDFAMKDHEKIINRLPGQKHLIIGNHDLKFKNKFAGWGFSWVKDVYELKVDSQVIWLSHYAHRTWPRKWKGAWHLFGHSHGRMDDLDKSTDVGVDSWNFYPVSFNQLKKRFKDE